MRTKFTLSWAVLLLMGTALWAGERPAEDPTVPVIQTRNMEADSPDLCPVCHRTRTECNNTGRKYRELIRQGKYIEAKKLNVCPVHLKNYGQVKSRPGVCPVCQHKVNIPLEHLRAKDLNTSEIDADLCPHPEGGKVRFSTKIPMCPNCGYAAFTQHFEKPLRPEDKAWVLQALTPNLRRAQRHLLGMKLTKLTVTDKELVELFDQETLPDVVRCEHALALYSRINAHPTWRIKLARQCAWAYRREVCAPLHGPFQMDSIRRVMKALERAYAGQKDVQERVIILAGFYDEKDRFSYLDRQVIRFLLAGYYDRLGLTGWTRTCLDRIHRGTTHPFEANDDPWLVGTEGPMNERLDEAKRRKAVIDAVAKIRMEQLNREMQYIALAADLIREGLKKGAWRETPQRIPTYVYLVGEMERRLEHFTRAKLWLDTAKQLLVAESHGAELYAPKQLEIMQDYMQQLKIAGFPADEHSQEDSALLSSLVSTVQLARGKLPTMPPAAMQGTKQTPPQPPHRNEVKLP